MYREEDREAKLKSLRSELKKVTGELIKVQDTCFRVFNAPIPFNKQRLENYKRMRLEEKRVLALFKLQKGDALEAYKNYFKRLHLTEDGLHRVKRDLEHEEMKNCRGMSEKIDKIRASMSFLKEFCIKFQMDVNLDLKKAREVCLEYIKVKESLAMSHISTLQAEIDTLTAKKEEMNEIKRRIKVSEVIHEEFDEIDPTVQRELAKLMAPMKKILSYDVSERMSLTPVYEGMEKLENKLKGLEIKFNELSQKIQERHQNYIHTKFAQISKGLLKIHNQAEAIQCAISNISEDNSILSEKLQKEREIASQVVGDTGMTVYELRKEIERLTREIGQEELDNNKILHSIKEERTQFESDMREIIEFLEDEQKSKLNRTNSTT